MTNIMAKKKQPSTFEDTIENIKEFLDHEINEYKSTLGGSHTYGPTGGTINSMETDIERFNEFVDNAVNINGFVIILPEGVELTDEDKAGLAKILIHPS